METESNVFIAGVGASREENNTKLSKTFPVKYKFSSIAPLKTCFEAIVSGNKVMLDLKTLELIIINDLKISTSQFDAALQQILPYMLVSYIKSWPGWSRGEDYKNGSLQLEEYFEKFLKYTTIKLTYLIQKGYQKAIEELKNDIPHKEIDPLSQKCVETQCESIDSLSDKSYSAFSVNIEGPPKLLNTLIFAAQQDDLIMKMHAIKKWSPEFDIQQLINWPFLEIEFSSPFLKFSRKVVPDYLRYLARTDDVAKCGKQEFIETVRVDPTVSRTTYSREFLKKYLKGYIKYLESKNLEPRRIAEIYIIFSEFYRDIEELGTVCENGICDSTTICFNIGGCRYVRNKKTAGMSSSNYPNAPLVGFCEIITPKCSIQLNKNVYAEQASNIDIVGAFLPTSFFESTQKIIEDQNCVETMPSIMYSCNYCKKQYGGAFALSAVINHYRDDHSMEHAIMCFNCKNLYNVTDLSITRWFHTCESNPIAKNPIAVNLFPNFRLL